MLRFSKKSFLIAFIAALILFSGIMAIVCYHAFSGHVFVRTEDNVSPEDALCVSEPSIYYCLNTDDGSLAYAVLVFRDAASGETYLMHVEGEWLVTYRDALYYVRSLYAGDGVGGLCFLYESLTGASINADAIDARTLLPESKRNSHFRFSDLAELLAESLGEEMKEISPSFSQNEAHRLIDVPSTRAAFCAPQK